METNLKDILPIQEGPAQTASSLARPSVWKRAKALGARLLSAVLPWFAIPGYCHSCWARLELVREMPSDRYEPYMAHGVRFWKCPDCGHGASTRYAYTGYTETEDLNLR